MGRGPPGRSRPNGVDFWWTRPARATAGRTTAKSRVTRPSSTPVLAARWRGRRSATRTSSECSPRARSGPIQCSARSATGPLARRRGGGAAARRMTPLCPPLGPLDCASQRPVRAGRAGQVNSREGCQEFNGATLRSRRAAVNGLRSRSRPTPSSRASRSCPRPTPWRTWRGSAASPWPGASPSSGSAPRMRRSTRRRTDEDRRSWRRAIGPGSAQRADRAGFDASPTSAAPASGAVDARGPAHRVVPLAAPDHEPRPHRVRRAPMPRARRLPERCKVGRYLEVYAALRADGARPPERRSPSAPASEGGAGSSACRRPGRDGGRARGRQRP